MMLSRIMSSRSETRTAVNAAGDGAFVHKADFVLRCPITLRDRESRSRVAKTLAYCGFGRALKQSLFLEDVDSDGKCILSVSCPEGVECVIRAANGKRVGNLAAAEKRVVQFDVPAGEYNVTWKEV